jgi:predicted dithiol-disulfide oxidoreductase (DUF899 family)
MSNEQVVDQAEWLRQRLEFLQQEKAFTRQRDALSAARRALPWVLVEKDYVFETAQGRQTLSELFGDCEQLMIYHFMYGPDQESGCPSCTFIADGMDKNTEHLAHRDIRLLLVGHAPFSKLHAYGERMGWSLDWASAAGSEFNADFNVSFTAEEIEQGEVTYNYVQGSFPSQEAPGLSVFIRDSEAQVFHTYSTYGRGLDMLIAAYNLIDLTPKGRDEEQLEFGMAWLRRRDEY